jgi:hypothetical protein
MRIPNFQWLVLLLALARFAGAQDTSVNCLPCVIETARSYDEHLPDFVCTQETHRAEDKTRTGTHWKDYDNYEAEVTYFGRREGCRLVGHNGKVGKRSCQEIKGWRSEGLFGNLFSWIFRPGTQTEFTFVRQEALGSRATHVYKYRVAQEHSYWQASANGRTVTKAFHGLVWADAATSSVVRIHAELDSDVDTQADVEYDFVTISSERFLLPVRAQARTSAGKLLLRNTTEYSHFHRYAADTSVEFGEPLSTAKPTK